MIGKTSGLLALTFVVLAAAQQDQTIQPGATGVAVVETVSQRLDASCVFPEDKLFTRRLAYVESEYGLNAATFRPGYFGGIWQCDQASFDVTRSSAANYVLLNYIKAIQQSFGIDWPSVSWNDLTKPLHSALCARLYLIYNTRSDPSGIPRDIESQGIYWEKYYRPGGDVDHFVNSANELEKDCTSSSGPDIIFVLDSSGSIGSSNFAKLKNFVTATVSSFNVGPAKAQTQFGLIKFSSSVKTEFTLNRYKNSADVVSAVNRITYDAGSTYTHLALDALASSGFTSASGARSQSEGHPRVAIVVTDGQSNYPSKTVVSALRVHDQDITSIAVGVGSKVDLNELGVIASDPSCSHVLLLVNFTEFSSLKYAIEKRSCEAPVIISPDNPGSSNELPPGDNQNCKLKVPDNGLTVKVSTSRGWTRLFLSKTNYPSRAFYEAVVSCEPGRPGVIFVPKPPTQDAEGIVYCNIDSNSTEASNITIDTKPGDNNPCNPNPCQNGGSCVGNGADFTCDCSAGYTGQRCDTPPVQPTDSPAADSCLSSPCFKGQCVTQENGFECRCDPGYIGTYCNEATSACSSSPCKHGECKPLNKRYECCCLPGWTGKYCDSPINECDSDPCVHGTCEDREAGYDCVCDPGYTGQHCVIDDDECKSNPCVNGDCQDLVNGYKCNCLPGWTGVNCNTDIDECESDPCIHGTCRNGANRFDCACDTDWTGVVCETNIDTCESRPCINGICKDDIGFHVCNCHAGWTGPVCETDIDECESFPCVRGTCNNLEAEWKCTCPPGYTGLHCETNIDECESGPCLNGATCKDGVNEYTCICAAGYTGTDCQTDIDDCKPTNPCVNGGTCTDGVDHYTCTCEHGYTGSECQTDIDECDSHPCVYGICHDDVNGYNCECHAGYTGINCETEINECLSNPCIHGVCVDLLDAYKCICTAGYTGKNCETDIDDCKPTNPCLNGGACKDGVDHYTCECQPGYIGSECQTDDDECLSQPCVHGTCHDLVNSYECYCEEGYTGTHCDIEEDECKSNPCVHGTCTDEINGYTCDCETGWIGTHCDCVEDNCAQNPCRNGVCVNDIGRYSCLCNHGYTGFRCETPIPVSSDTYDCSTRNPCQYGLEEEFYYPHADETKFVQCSQWGQCTVQDCPLGTVWSQPIHTCTHKTKKSYMYAPRRRHF